MDRRNFLAACGGLSSLTLAGGCAASEVRSGFLNVALIGHQGHGKSTLATALVRETSAGGASPPITASDGALTFLEFQSGPRSYALIDAPGAVGAVPAVIGGLRSADVAVLVVSAADGPMRQTREHILLARQMGVEDVIVFLSKTDLNADPELIELISLEVRELLNSYALKGYAAPLVTGSAKRALDGGAVDRRSVRELISVLDRSPLPVRRVSQPFRMIVEDVFQIAGRGIVVTGRVDQGRIVVGDSVALLTASGEQTVRCQGVEMFRRILTEASAGDHIGLLLADLNRTDVQRGDVLAAPGSARRVQQIQAESYVLTTEEGGFASVPSPWRGTVYFDDGLDVPVSVRPLDGVALRPGDVKTLAFAFDHPTAVERIRRFVVRDEDRTVAVGVTLP